MQKKATPERGCSSRKSETGLRLVLGGPVAQSDVFLYFSPFIAMFLRFVRPIVNLAEWVFGIPNYVRYEVQRF